MLLQKKIEKRKRRRFQIGPATPGEVSGTKKRDNFLEKNPVKTVENYCFHCLSLAGQRKPATGAGGSLHTTH